jgi:hypothetical protein
MVGHLSSRTSSLLRQWQLATCEHDGLTWDGVRGGDDLRWSLLAGSTFGDSVGDDMVSHGCFCVATGT